MPGFELTLAKFLRFKVLLISEDFPTLERPIKANSGGSLFITGIWSMLWAPAKKSHLRLKTAENGKLFGSVTSKEIGDELKKKSGIEIEKKKITLDEQIKVTGVYTAKVKLYEGVTASLKVRVSGI